jgi:HEAT repeat protein
LEESAEPTGLEPAPPFDPPDRPGRQLEPALGGFFEAMLHARSPHGVVPRVQALLRLGDAGDRRAVPALLVALGDRDWIVRKYAASGLGRVGAEEATGPLQDALADPRPEVRRAAARALARLGGAPQAAWLIAIEDADWLVREVATEALGRDPSEAATGALLSALADPVWLNRYQALQALRDRPDPRVLQALLDALHHDRELSPWLGPAIAEAGPAALEPLLALLDDAPPWRQLAIAAALGRLDDDRARAALSTMVGHPDSEIEDAIAHHGRAMAGYLVRASDSADWMIRWHACKLLGRHGDPGAAEALVRRLADARPEVRLAALDALSRLAPPGAEPALVGLLADPSWRIRLGATEALGAIATPGAINSLVDTLADPRSEVRQAARRSLQALGAAAVPALESGVLRRPECYDEIAWLLRTLKRPDSPPA